LKQVKSAALPALDLLVAQHLAGAQLERLAVPARAPLSRAARAASFFRRRAAAGARRIAIRMRRRYSPKNARRTGRPVGRCAYAISLVQQLECCW